MNIAVELMKVIKVKLFKFLLFKLKDLDDYFIQFLD